MPGFPDSLIAGVIALVAAFLGALGSVLQARVVLTEVSPDAGLQASMLKTLVRKPMWLAGVGIAGLGFVFHGLALAEGTLVEVEPLLVLSLVFALPLGAWLCKQTVGQREWVAATAVVVGLLVFLLSANPTPGDRHLTRVGWLIILGVVAAVMAGFVWCSKRTTRPATAAVLLGSAAAVGLATGALILKSWTNQLASQGVGAILDWRTFVLAGGGFMVLLIQQSAYRAGPFAAALSPMIGLNPILAGVLGVIAYGDRVHDTPGRTAIALVGVALVAGGLLRLSRAPAITLDALKEESPTRP